MIRIRNGRWRRKVKTEGHGPRSGRRLATINEKNDRHMRRNRREGNPRTGEMRMVSPENDILPSLFPLSTLYFLLSTLPLLMGIV
jgi:hypothetical protein